MGVGVRVVVRDAKCGVFGGTGAGVSWSLNKKPGRDGVDPLSLRGFEWLGVGVGGGSDLRACSGGADIAARPSTTSCSGCGFVIDWRSFTYRCIVGKRWFLYPSM
jgi:hypothetical protein